ncbi:hypothetical protein E2C01_026112 [Portunus trituberculatus]|uniref:Uncharacterized protein n=1 Tax=Portunus trituberculatus TaxID=210409 RepID=A0A5B7EIA4_PORTR|nr:hypothetical protein [Portunus trituberculatus]
MPNGLALKALEGLSDVTPDKSSGFKTRGGFDSTKFQLYCTMNFEVARSKVKHFEKVGAAVVQWNHACFGVRGVSKRTGLYPVHGPSHILRSLVVVVVVTVMVVVVVVVRGRPEPRQALQPRDEVDVLGVTLMRIAWLFDGKGLEALYKAQSTLSYRDFSYRVLLLSRTHEKLLKFHYRPQMPAIARPAMTSWDI